MSDDMSGDLPDIKPVSPFSEIMVACTGLNEIYRGLLEGGFEKKEALYIIACFMGGAARGE